MSAIDKMYLHSYEELDDFRRWCLVYYPKPILYMYNIGWIMSYNDFIKSRDKWIKEQMKLAKKQYSELGSFETKEQAALNYRKTHSWCTFNEAIMNVVDIIDRYYMNKENWEDGYSFPVMNTPFSVDHKLKWICPAPCVREYLHKQCGVNPKWEWLYRIFWRGKKYF